MKSGSNMRNSSKYLHIYRKQGSQNILKYLADVNKINKHLILSQSASNVVGDVDAYHSGFKSSVVFTLVFHEAGEVSNILCRIKSRAVGLDGLHKDLY